MSRIRKSIIVSSGMHRTMFQRTLIQPWMKPLIIMTNFLKALHRILSSVPIPLLFEGCAQSNASTYLQHVVDDDESSSENDTRRMIVSSSTVRKSHVYGHSLVPRTSFKKAVP